MLHYLRKAVWVVGVLSVGLASHAFAYSRHIYVYNHSKCDQVRGKVGYIDFFSPYGSGYRFSMPKGGFWRSWDALDLEKYGVDKIVGYCWIKHESFIEQFRLVPYTHSPGESVWYSRFEVKGPVKGMVRVVPVKSSAYFPAEN